MDICLMIFQLLVLLPLVISAYNQESNNPRNSRTLPLFNTSSSSSKSNSNSTIYVRVRDLPYLPLLIIPVFLSAKAEAREIVGDSSRELEKSGSSHELDYDFYRESCPRAEQIVRDAVRDLYRARPDVAPILLRLVFHDYFIQGCDASVLLNSTREIASEKDSPPNETLKGFGVIDTIESKLEEECPGVVSCADTLVLAARDSVSLSGGPYYPVHTGRQDSTLLFPDHAKTELPSPHDYLPTLLALFAWRGFNERKLVSLVGTPSIGVTHCKFFENRLYNFAGTNEPDPSLDTEFLQLMRTLCNHTRNTAAAADGSSYEEPLIPLNYEGSAFGSQYFHTLLQGKGILYADQQLTAVVETGKWVTAYALNTTLFRWDFASVMMKLSDLHVLTAPMGQIRISLKTT